jgi:ribonuclease G
MSSKELVISSNRHETRLAIMEDDQLVEVYFQRANEYSLAGSIHKGRVTRVLPGMQSAFVDLGLERDTFLYVSDFLEEHHEDFDKVTGGAEERSARLEGESRAVRLDGESRAVRLEGENRAARPDGGGRRDEDRGGRHDRRSRRDRDRDRNREAAPAEAPPVPTEAAPAPVEAVTAEPVTEAAPAGEARPRRDDRDRDRGGRRRGRRRRGGRGFPESKYAGDDARATEAREEAAEEPAEESAAAEEIILLPGESLRKYRGATPPPLPATEEEEEPVEEEVIEVVEEIVEEEAAEPVAAAAIATVPETIITTYDPVEHPPANAIPDAPLHMERLAEPPVAKDEEITARIEQTVDDAEAEFLARQAAGEDVEIIEELIEVEEEAEEGAESSADDELADEVPGSGEAEDPDIQAMVMGEDGGDPLDEIQAAAEEAAESSPVTARVGEQRDGRFLRQGRRGRRRGRGGRDDRGPRPEGEARPAEAAQPAEPAAAPEPKAPRPERRPQRHFEHQKGTPSIADLLKEGQEIIVQIAKEPLGQKGARITSHIALPGRYVVFMPTLDHMGVSRKIASDDERQRLKRVLQEARKTVQGGCIIRTAGEGRPDQEILDDIQFLYNLWLDIKQKAEKRPAPLLLHHDLDIVQRVLRDQFNETYKAVWVDNEEMYESVLRFVQRFQPGLVHKVKMYTRPLPIFDAFNISQELEKALRPKVWLKSGGYIVINQTEALVAIDINTGKFVGKSNRLEDTIVKTNLEAVKEIVRQVRLRDLGGIIVIDFIDMDERKNRQKVMQALEEAMRQDRAPYKILQFNDFGLVAITRKRVKQSLERTMCAPCPYCEGAGYVKSVGTVMTEILQEAHKIAAAVEGSEVLLRVNPEVAKMLKSNQNQYLEELEEVLKRPVLVKSDPALHQEKFDLA